ncbi:MAG: TonB-dependent receptor [Steroidobacteraceae bacterium]
MVQRSTSPFPATPISASGWLRPRADRPTGARSQQAKHALLHASVASACFWALPVDAQSLASAQDLKHLSLEELLDVQVTSVSRKQEQLLDAPAAIAVLTSEDIRRSGATTLPETLRGVPGLHVAQINASEWAISSRGFSSVNSEKLLVLTDSRSIYTPLYSGVFWDAQDYLLADIDRIEVIRGPGATQWGSNAVNGVINIQTKHAKDTQGPYVEVGAGDELQTLIGARYGAQFAEDGYVRVYGKYADHDSTPNDVAQSDDGWHTSRFGLRADWQFSEVDSLTLQGDIYRGEVGQHAPSINVIGRPGPTGDLEVDLRGGNILGRWQRMLVGGSDLQLRVYYDHTRREDASYDDRLDTIDIDFQHHFQFAQRHDIVWGVAYRTMDNRNEGKGIFALQPRSSTDDLISGFVQDEIALSDVLHITFGSKVEHNDFSGVEIQPSVRAAWRVAPDHILWAAIARAVRVPTRIERDIAVDASNPTDDPVFRLLGNDDFDAEELLAYELGHRWQARDNVFIDAAVFYNSYDNLATLELSTPFAATSGQVVIPLRNENQMDGVARGLETQLTYALLPSLRLTASYTYVDLELDPSGLDLNRGAFLEGSTPKHQFTLRSQWDLPAGWQLDAQWRHLSDIESMPEIVDGTGIDGYSELDVRVAWRASEQFELALVGRNLLHDHHTEFGVPEDRGAIEQSAYAKVTWTF